METGIELIGVKEALEKFNPQIVAKATTAALNKVGAQAFTEASKQIREDYAVSASGLKKSFEFRKAKGTAWLVELRAKGKGTPLIYFQARQTKPGVTAIVKRSSGRKLYPHRFIATMRTGHKGVYMRKGKARLPIKEEYRIGIATAFGSKKVMNATRRVIAEKWKPVFKNAMDFYMGKANISYERLD